MELMLVIRILLRRWWLVLVPVAITAAVAVPDFLSSRSVGGGGFTTVIRYSAAQELEAIPNRDGDYQDVWLASELTVNALTAWIQTGSFKAEVANELQARGVEIDPAALSIVGDNERSLGQIVLGWSDATELEQIAEVVIDVLQTRSQTYFPQLGGQPAHVTLLDDPMISPAPPPIVNRFAPFIKVGLGLLAGIGLAFLVEYLDTRVRGRAEVESLGLRVIATIPRHK